MKKFMVLTLENAAFPTTVNSRQKVDVPVGCPVKLLVAHEVLQVDVSDDTTGVFTRTTTSTTSSSPPGNLTLNT